ncbi:MAG: hypothetical protein AB1793_06490 [Candidatus Thermoplasmatota archaeon]
MGIRLERGSDGRMRIGKDGERRGRFGKRALTIGIAVALAAVAVSGIGVALAGGDQNQLTHGEDDGYYDDNNCNPFDDEPFPGEDTQNRTGV